MSRPAADAPSLAVLASGGIGVLVVVAFVVALALGSSSSRPAGSLVRVVAAPGGGAAVLAGRCLDQRVTSVAVSSGGSVRWRIVSAQGSIERRYVVGSAEVPLGFTTEVPLAGALAGEVRAEVGFVESGEATADAVVADVGSLPPEGDVLEGGAPACGDDGGPGALTWLFAFGAAFVLGGYLAMVRRYLRR